MGVESSYKPGLQSFYNYDIQVLDHGNIAYAKTNIAHLPQHHLAQGSLVRRPARHPCRLRRGLSGTDRRRGLDRQFHGRALQHRGAALGRQYRPHGQRHDLQEDVRCRRTLRYRHHADLERPLSGEPGRHRAEDHARQCRRQRQHPVALPGRGDRRIPADRPASQALDGRPHQLGGVRLRRPDQRVRQGHGGRLGNGHRAPARPQLSALSGHRLAVLPGRPDGPEHLQHRLLRAPLPGLGRRLHRLRSGARPGLDVAQHERQRLHRARRQRDEDLFHRHAGKQHGRPGEALHHQWRHGQVRPDRGLLPPRHVARRRPAGLAVRLRGDGPGLHRRARQYARRSNC